MIKHLQCFPLTSIYLLTLLNKGFAGNINVQSEQVPHIFSIASIDVCECCSAVHNYMNCYMDPLKAFWQLQILIFQWVVQFTQTYLAFCQLLFTEVTFSELLLVVMFGLFRLIQHCLPWLFILFSFLSPLFESSLGENMCCLNCFQKYKNHTFIIIAANCTFLLGAAALLLHSWIFTSCILGSFVFVRIFLKWPQEKES